MKAKIINKSKHELPKYATENSAGMDLRANIDKSITIYSGEVAMVPTGLFIQLPKGYEAQIRPRSGLAAKFNVTVANSPGTIDSDYRGEICVLLTNHGVERSFFTINDGDRIAQMVIAKYETVEWESVDSLDETERGEGGFGHTGNK